MQLCDSVKSKERVQEHGEVFTPPRVVNMMLELLQKNAATPDLPDVFAPETTFLDPACGQGQFPLEILKRKFSRCKKLNDYQTAALSVWGIDIQSDNLQECISNVLELCREHFRVSKALAAQIEAHYILGDSLKIMPFLSAYCEKIKFVYVLPRPAKGRQ